MSYTIIPGYGVYAWRLLRITPEGKRIELGRYRTREGAIAACARCLRYGQPTLPERARR